MTRIFTRQSKRWLALGLLAMATSAFAAGQAMSVQVKSGQLRETPSFLGKLTGTVNYGERLQVLEQKGDWSKVTVPSGQTGWLHSSALTKKRIVMKAGDQSAQAGASGDELALAGKGFNSDVEADFKAKNRNVDFAWVDKMEKFKVKPEAMEQFLTDGGIQPQEGGKR